MTDTLGLGDFRSQIATWLAAELPDNVGVFDAIPDSIAPPVVYVTWSSPWLTPTTWCDYTATLQLLLVAQRIEPGGQYGVLEGLVSQVLSILKGHRVALRDVSTPYPMVFAGVNYLATSVNIIQEM